MIIIMYLCTCIIILKIVPTAVPKLLVMKTMDDEKIYSHGEILFRELINFAHEVTCFVEK